MALFHVSPLQRFQPVFPEFGNHNHHRVCRRQRNWGEEDPLTMVDQILGIDHPIFPIHRRNRNHTHCCDEKPNVVNDENKFSMAIDVNHFKPDEIKVTTMGKEVTIEAKHEDENENGFVSRKMVRKMTIPDDIDPKELTSRLTHNGRLMVEAPKMKKEKESKEWTIPVMVESKEAIEEEKKE